MRHYCPIFFKDLTHNGSKFIGPNNSKDPLVVPLEKRLTAFSGSDNFNIFFLKPPLNQSPINQARVSTGSVSWIKISQQDIIVY